MLFIALLLSVLSSAATPEQAAGELAQRVLGDRAAEFRFVLIPAENGRDVFEVEARDGVATVGGSTGVAMASGLNWYLKYECHCHVSWLRRSTCDCPKPLPDFAEGAAGVAVQAPLLLQLLRVQLHAGVVGLAAVGADDRLDGPARHQHAAGGHRPGGGLAEGLSTTWD